MLSRFLRSLPLKGVSGAAVEDLHAFGLQQAGIDYNMRIRSEDVYTKPCRLRSSYVCRWERAISRDLKRRRLEPAHLAVVDVALLILELLRQLRLRQLGTAFLLELLRHCARR
jgi:hypothetical protein